MMKSKFIGLIIVLLSCYTLAPAQKFGYIDSDFIIKKMPEYKKAETELTEISQKWQKEIESLKLTIDKLQADFRSEEVLLSEEMKKERQDTIVAKEKKLKEQQKKIFGFEGLIFLKRQELMKPVQDKVFEAVEKVSKAKQLQIMFDKSGDLVMIYTNPVHDYTDFVLDQLGLGDPNDTVEGNENE
ncbi:MAG TPA: OmpH family outer membrane protein, partial [Cytophagaceae bacterium]